MMFAMMALAAIPSPVRAEATHMTITFHSATMTFVTAGGPCPVFGAGVITTIYNGVIHQTNDSGGGFHYTFTAAGDFTYVQNDPTRPTYTGHFAQWFGVNVMVDSSGVIEAGATFSVHGTGTDGSIIGFKAVSHMTILPDGTVTGLVLDMMCR